MRQDDDHKVEDVLFERDGLQEPLNSTASQLSSVRDALRRRVISLRNIVEVLLRIIFSTGIVRHAHSETIDTSRPGVLSALLPGSPAGRLTVLKAYSAHR